MWYLLLSQSSLPEMCDEIRFPQLNFKLQITYFATGGTIFWHPFRITFTFVLQAPRCTIGVLILTTPACSAAILPHPCFVFCALFPFCPKSTFHIHIKTRSFVKACFTAMLFHPSFICFAFAHRSPICTTWIVVLTALLMWRTLMLIKIDVINCNIRQLTVASLSFENKRKGLL